MYLVDEEHIVGLERREEAGQVAGLVEHRSRRDLESHPQLVGDDVAQRGLSQSGRTVEQGVVERFMAIFGGLNKDPEVFHNLGLTVEVVETERAKRVLEVFLLSCDVVFSYVEIVNHVRFNAF